MLRFGERFPSLNNAYDNELRLLAKETGKELSFESFLREGVYACVGGPSFETPAEINYLHKVCIYILFMPGVHPYPSFVVISPTSCFNSRCFSHTKKICLNSKMMFSFF